MQPVPPAPPSDEELIRRAQRRLMPGAALCGLTAAFQLMIPILGYAAVAAIGLYAYTSAPNSPPPTDLIVMIGVFGAMGLLLFVPPLGIAIPTALAWQMRSPDWVLGAGIAGIVVSCIHAGLLMCAGQGLGCLLIPIPLAMGMTGGIWLIVALQHPDVEAGLAAKKRWLLEDRVD